MKICYIADPDIIISLRYMKYFVDRGHEVSLIPSKIHDFDLSMEGNELDGIKVHFDNRIRNERKIYKLIVPIKDVLKVIKPDIIHIHSLTTQIAKATAFSAGKIPLVLMPWGADLLKSPQGGIRNWLITKLALKRLSAVVAPSAIMLQYAAYYGVHPSLTHLITTGTDLMSFNLDVDYIPLKNKLNIPPNAKVILAPRQWSEKQNTELILRSVPLVLKEFPNVYFVFKNVIGNLGSKLHAIVDELSLSNRVFLIDRDEPPFISYANLPPFYRMADAVLSIPSWDTGGPSTLMETMACGSVPIVSKANSQWVRHKMSGFVLNHITIDSIAESIVEVLSEPNWVKHAREINHMIIKWGADVKVGMSKIESLYENILESRDYIQNNGD